MFRCKYIKILVTIIMCCIMLAGTVYADNGTNIEQDYPAEQSDVQDEISGEYNDTPENAELAGDSTTDETSGNEMQQDALDNDMTEINNENENPQVSISDTNSDETYANEAQKNDNANQSDLNVIYYLGLINIIMLLFLAALLLWIITISTNLKGIKKLLESQKLSAENEQKITLRIANNEKQIEKLETEIYEHKKRFSNEFEAIKKDIASLKDINKESDHNKNIKGDDSTEGDGDASVKEPRQEGGAKKMPVSKKYRFNENDKIYTKLNEYGREKSVELIILDDSEVPKNQTKDDYADAILYEKDNEFIAFINTEKHKRLNQDTIDKTHLDYLYNTDAKFKEDIRHKFHYFVSESNYPICQRKDKMEAFEIESKGMIEIDDSK